MPVIVDDAPTFPCTLLCIGGFMHRKKVRFVSKYARIALPPPAAKLDNMKTAIPGYRVKTQLYVMDSLGLGCRRIWFGRLTSMPVEDVLIRLLEAFENP